MKRPDPVLRHLTAVMLYAWSLVAVDITWGSKSVPRWVTAAVLCWLAVIAAYQALQATWRACRGTDEESDEAAPPPAASVPLWPANVNDAAFDAYTRERLIEASYGSHAHGGRPLVMPAHGSRDGDTVVMQADELAGALR